MNNSPLLTLTITELGGLGDGIALHENTRIIVPYTLPGDVAKVRMRSKHKAELVEIIQAASQRTAPPCLHFSQCGGCTMQHLPDSDYIMLKERMLETAVSRAGYSKEAIAPMVRIPPYTRRRTHFKVQADTQLAEIGYYAAGSHSLLAISECPVLKQPILQLMHQLKPLLPRLAHPELLREIAITHTDSGMDIIMIADTPPESADMDVLGEFAASHDIARISWQSEGMLLPLITRRATALAVGQVALTLPETYFLQATSEGQAAITAFISDATQNATTIADLYAGCGTYSFAMCGYAHVTAIEGAPAMIQAMKSTINTYRLEKNVTAKQRDLYKNPLTASALSAFDAVVINPPRNGAGTQIQQLALSNTPLIVMISCNPGSFERDAKLLREGGYQLEKAVAIDQFVWSSHLEVAALFRKYPTPSN
jgi:23S rRNA (uracil1939-C5)-methyltransferase